MTDTDKLTVSKEIDENIKKGIQLYGDGELDKALEIFKQILEKTEEREKELRIFKIPTCIAIGLICQKKSKYKEALSFYLESLQLSIESNDIMGYSNAKFQIGVILNLKGKFKEALEIFKEYVRIRRKIGDKIGILYGLKNLAQTYEQFGSFYLRKGDQERAIQYFKEGLKISRQITQKAETVSQRGAKQGTSSNSIIQTKKINILGDFSHSAIITENVIEKRIASLLEDDYDKKKSSKTLEYLREYFEPVAKIAPDKERQCPICDKSLEQGEILECIHCRDEGFTCKFHKNCWEEHKARQKEDGQNRIRCFKHSDIIIPKRSIRNVSPR